MDTGILDSFKENLLQKTRNPFLATVIIVWTFKNWRLVYTLFNFEESQNLAYRISFIENYYSEVDFYTNLFKSIGYAFIVFIATYLLLSASRIIINIYEKIITPYLYKWTDNTSIVLKSTLLKQIEENVNLESRIGVERDKRLSAESARDSLEVELKERNNTSHILRAELDELSVKYKKSEEARTELANQKLKTEDISNQNNQIKNSYESLRRRFDELEQENQNLKIENDNLVKAVYDFKEKETASKDGYPEYFDDSTIRAIQKIENLSFAYELLTIGSQILNNEPIKKVDKNTRYLSSLGLIIPSSEYEHNKEYSYYDLTEKGKAVFEYFNEIK